MEYNIKKVANAIIYFIDSQVQNISKTKVMKLLFFADKIHLERYGKPIFYDDYIALQYGPIPSLTLNIINSINEPEKEDFKSLIKEFLEYVRLNEQYDEDMITTTFEKKKEFNQKLFSQSEIEILNEISQKYKNYTAKKLSKLTHTLPEYKKHFPNGKIKYDELAGENSEYVNFIEKENESFEELFS